MENPKLERPWNEVRELMIEIEPALSGEDLNYVVGEETELIERIANIMNRTPEHTKAWIESVSYNTDRAS